MIYVIGVSAVVEIIDGEIGGGFVLVLEKSRDR